MKDDVKVKVGHSTLSKDASSAASDLAPSFSARYRALAGLSFN